MCCRWPVSSTSMRMMLEKPIKRYSCVWKWPSYNQHHSLRGVEFTRVPQGILIDDAQLRHFVTLLLSKQRSKKASLLPRPTREYPNGGSCSHSLKVTLSL